MQLEIPGREVVTDSLERLGSCTARELVLDLVGQGFPSALAQRGVRRVLDSRHALIGSGLRLRVALSE